MNKRIFAAAPVLLALLLGGCGGGDSTAGSTQLASHGGDVPAPQAVDTAAFIKLAQGEACADQKNRLWLIDGKEVFWDRSATKCPDNNWSRKLYGATPETVLCSSSDSIAGPVTTCANDSVRALFDTIQKNLDAPNLGLDATHKVEPIQFQSVASGNKPVTAAEMHFTTLVKEWDSGITQARNVVIRDQAGLEKLWADNYSINGMVPPVPAVDFSQNMLIGVFLGENNLRCGNVAIAAVTDNKSKIVVDYERIHVPADAVCATVVEHQMHLVSVARSDAPVEFAAHDVDRVAINYLEYEANSGVHAPREVVVKDEAGWAALWAEHAGKDRPLPAVDFSKQMVVGIFLGPVMSCESLRVDGASTDGKQIRVSYTHMLPPMGVMCIATVANPAQLLVIDRSDLPVVFHKDMLNQPRLGH